MLLGQKILYNGS